jgi:endonuclease/exonuclease/phosphatase (EEP) superfamily protein YafD
MWMRSRLRSLFSLHLPVFFALEAALIGIFFIHALRFVVGGLYARTASATLFPALDPSLIDPALPGLVDPVTVSGELNFLMLMLVLPLLSMVVGRFRVMLAVAGIITAVGRYLMASSGSDMPITEAAVVIGGGLLYITLVTRHRAQVFPYMILLALAVDQLYRAVGNTLDPSWSTDYANTQLLLSGIAVALALYTSAAQRTEHRNGDTAVSADNGLLPFWSGIGIGALLFVQLSLLALPNAIAGRANTDYTTFVPLLIIATLLPLVPWIRGQARFFIGLFDSGTRGWVWMLLIMLLLVFGARIRGIPAGSALVLAQFGISMVWWWLVRPRAQHERSFSGLWIIGGILVFGVLTVFDIFTYEYAFVRDFSPDLAFLNDFIPPLLRGFRELGLVVLLLAVFLGMIPMIQTRRRIAWVGGGNAASFLALLVVATFTAGAAFAARPPVVTGISNPETIRVGTYNIHAGYNEFFHYDLEAIARTIQQSGANVILLQEVEAGRMTSFGVDQPLWLARRLGMDRRFFGTNEGLQGLAVLSNIEIVFNDGALLDSATLQTGLQRVQIRPDTGIITIYNTWLDPLLIIGPESPTEVLELGQQAQLSQIFNIIRAHHPDGQRGRMVIGGTFNNVPDSDLIQRMRSSGFVDHFAALPLELSATFWRTGQRARLDYLWTWQMQVIGANVIDTNASDHRLAVLGIQLR